eukprot:5101280-Prymnesium_polylepis.1
MAGATPMSWPRESMRDGFAQANAVSHPRVPPEMTVSKLGCDCVEAASVGRAPHPDRHPPNGCP